MMQDTVADMLTRIRNAQTTNKKMVSMASSNLKEAIARVLHEEGYIEDFQVSQASKPVLTISLKYYSGRPVIEKLERVSRPGLRIYRNSRTVPSVLNGLGIAIISTPKGVITDRKAKALNVGGEVLCFVH